VPLGQPSGRCVVTGQEPDFGSPQPDGPLGCSSSPLEGLRGPQQLRGQESLTWTICCTDFVLISFSDVASLLSRRGLSLVRSLFPPLVVLLPGVGKKFNF